VKSSSTRDDSLSACQPCRTGHCSGPWPRGALSLLS
jgi:hypothetical protein